MLGGTGPVLCLLLAPVLCLTVPAVACAGSPVEEYLAEQRAAAGLSPRPSIADSTARMPKSERTSADMFLEQDALCIVG